jgi:hypothetical protein
LLGQAVEIDQRPDHGHEEGQGDQAKSYENQAIK